MKYKEGDTVRTIKDRDLQGNLLFPVGSIGLILDAKEGRQYPYKVEVGAESWYYAEDMLETFKTYEQGLNDAWKLAQKINCYADEGGISQGELMKIFDSGDTCKIMCLSYEEALSKLKAYEDSKIEVGDVVETNAKGVELLVTALCSDKNRFDGIKVTPTDEYGKLGSTYSSMLKENFKKTGRYIDIQSILEVISEV